MNLAVITGADGGMGMEITRAVATAGYQVIMACRDPQAAEPKRQLLMRETGNAAFRFHGSGIVHQQRQRLSPLQQMLCKCDH